MSDLERAVERARIAELALAQCGRDPKAVDDAQQLAEQLGELLKKRTDLKNYHVVTAVWALLDALLSGMQQQVDERAATASHLKPSDAIN